MSKILIEVDEEEFVAIVSALEYVSGQHEIRSLFTDGEKSSVLSYVAGKIYEDLADGKFEEVYDRYITNYYATEGTEVGTNRKGSL